MGKGSTCESPCRAAGAFGIRLMLVRRCHTGSTCQTHAQAPSATVPRVTTLEAATTRVGMSRRRVTIVTIRCQRRPGFGDPNASGVGHRPRHRNRLCREADVSWHPHPFVFIESGEERPGECVFIGP